MAPDDSLAPPLARSGLSRSAALQWARASVDRLDARLLLEYVAGCTAAQLLAHPELLLGTDDVVRYESLVSRRAAGEPLAYLVGSAGFMGDVLEVSPAVLVPRPETEELVTWALALLADCAEPRIVDLGTGSGAIALALAGARPDARVLAIDVSPEALVVAARNRERLARPNVTFSCASWLAGVADEAAWDLIISNPPYIDVADPHLAGDGVRFEPRLALTDGGNGLSAYISIVRQAVTRLKPGGWLLVEHGHDQAAPIAQLWRDAGLVAVACRADLSGNPRMTVGRRLMAQGGTGDTETAGTTHG